ncbi:MAG: NADH-quinone oxidoreductase subunit N [Caldilineaceae bacterium]|nr:NADH-quinone oxidoreductase subunit N [Caldilineaceae bacterium]
MPELNINFHYVLPPLLMALGGCVVLTEGLVLGARKHTLFFVTTLITAAASLGASLCLRGEVGAGFSDAVIIDGTVVLLLSLVAICVILGALVSPAYLNRYKMKGADYYTLMLFAACGMQVLVSAGDLSTLFIGLETMSVSVYALTGYRIRQDASTEGAMKYFLLGAFSSGVFVFGIALTYGATGSTALPEVLAGIADGGSLGLAGAAMMLVGLGFKVAAAPFHMWTPDVYEGAPTVVTAFMSVGAKVGGFAAMLRVFVSALPEIGDTWVPAVAVIAALTLLVGNIVAIMQSNIKRMLAYSSIAHAGYILIAVAASGQTSEGLSAALFYMFAYLFTNMGAFAVVLAMEHKYGEGTALNDYAGLAKRHPLMALAMAYFMLSLTGVPPTGGFSGKFYVFRSAIEASTLGSDLIWLVIIGVITSVISGYYYLRVVFLMYMTEGDATLVGERHPAVVTATAVAVAFTLLLGFMPGAWFDITRQVVLSGAQALVGG